MSRAQQLTQLAAGAIWDATNGRLGIGTSSPAGSLHVYKNTNSSSVIRAQNASSGSNAYSVFQAYNDIGSVVELGIQSSTRSTTYPAGEGWIYASNSLNVGHLGSTKIYAGGGQQANFSSTGVIGFGVNPYAWTSNIGVLDFKNDGGLSSDANYAYLSNNVYFDGTNKRKSSGKSAVISVGKTGVPFKLDYTSSSDVANTAITFSEAFRVSDAANFLIGGTTDVGRLGVWGQIAKVTVSGIDGTFDNVIKYGTSPDLSSGTASANRWIGLDATVSAGAGSSNVLRVRAYPGTNGNAAPVNVVDFRGDQVTRFYGGIVAGTTGLTGGGIYQFSSTSKTNIYSSDSGYGQLQIGNPNSAGECSIGFIPGTSSFGSPPTSANGSTYVWCMGYGTNGYNGFAIFNSGAGGNVCQIAYNSTGWSFPSDERLKDIDGTITDATNKVMQLRAVYFNWKKNPGEKRKVGLIAQDVLKVLPEAVEVPEEETKPDGTLNYLALGMSDVVPLLVAAIQELKSEFDAYKATHP